MVGAGEEHDEGIHHDKDQHDYLDDEKPEEQRNEQKPLDEDAEDWNRPHAVGMLDPLSKKSRIRAGAAAHLHDRPPSSRAQ